MAAASVFLILKTPQTWREPSLPGGISQPVTPIRVPMVTTVPWGMVSSVVFR